MNMHHDLTGLVVGSEVAWGVLSMVRASMTAQTSDKVGVPMRPVR